ncbi:MAG: T9SS type A sorting domain-containing protein [Bacteroidales bacterium]
MTGKHVYSTSFITGGGNVNRKAITNKIMKDKGMYFLTVTAKSKTITTKIIVVD